MSRVSDPPRPSFGSSITGPGFEALPKMPVTRDVSAQPETPTHRLLTHRENLEPRVAHIEGADPIPFDDADDIDGVRLARRLFVAAILIAITAIVCWVILPQYGMTLPVMVPPLVFVAIFLGAVLTHAEEHAERDDEMDLQEDPSTGLAPTSNAIGQACQTPDGDGRPITCGGPRPPRFLRK